MVNSSTPRPHTAYPGHDDVDIRALMLLVKPNIYAANVFRIIGIPIDATARDIAKQMAQRKLRAELGDTSSTTSPFFEGGPVPSIDQLREADQQLRDPLVRLLHELFWFWPMDTRGSASDAALHALAAGDTGTAEKLWRAMESNPQIGRIAIHNMAIRWHIAALNLEQAWTGKNGDEKTREALTQCWRSSMKRWRRILADNAFWHFIAARVIGLDDPRVTLSHVDEIRRHFAQALVGINVQLALEHTESESFDLVIMHVRLIRDSHALFATPEPIALLVLSGAKGRIRRRVEAAKTVLRESPRTAIDASRELAGFLKCYVRLFGMLDLSENQDSGDAIDEGVSVALNCAIESNKHTDDDAAFVDVVGNLSNLATGATLKARTAKNLDIGKNALLAKQLSPVYQALAAIRDSSASPEERLRAFERDVYPLLSQALEELPASESARTALADAVANLLRGISVDAWNNGKHEKTALAAIKRAMAVPGSNEGNKALYDDFHTLQKLVHKWNTTQRNKKLKFLGWTAAAIACFVWISIVINEAPTTSSSISLASAAGGNPQNIGVTPASQGADPSNPADRSQRSYMVPATATAQLEAESANINSQKLIAKHLEAELASRELALNLEQERADAIDVEVDAMKDQLDRSRLTVDHSDQDSIASYNSRVDEYNRLVQKSRAQRRKTNALVGPNNDLVVKVNMQQAIVNRMVDAYNNHLQQVGH